MNVSLVHQLETTNENVPTRNDRGRPGCRIHRPGGGARFRPQRAHPSADDRLRLPPRARDGSRVSRRHHQQSAGRRAGRDAQRGPRSAFVLRRRRARCAEAAGAAEWAPGRSMAVRRPRCDGACRRRQRQPAGLAAGVRHAAGTADEWHRLSDHHQIRQQEPGLRDRQDLYADWRHRPGQSGVGPDAERKVPLARSHRRDARLLGRRTRSRAERLGLPLDDDGDAPDPGGLDRNRYRRLRAGDGGVRDCLRDDADPVRPLPSDRDRRRHLRRRRDQRLRRLVDGARRLHRPRPSHRHETAAAGRFDVRRQARQVDGESRTGRQSRPARGTGRRLVRFARLARAPRPEQRAAELSDRRGRHAGRRPASRFGPSIRSRVGDGDRRAHRLHAGGQPRALGMERVQEAAAGRRSRGGRAGRATTRLAASRSGRRDGADARRRRHRVRSPAVRRIVRQPVGGAGHRRCGEAGGHGNVRAAGATDREAGPRMAPVHPAVAGRKWRHHGRADPRPGDAAGGADPYRRSRVAGIYNAGASIEWQFGTESTANAQYNSTALVAFQRDKALEAVAASLAFIISGMEAVQ